MPGVKKRLKKIGSRKKKTKKSGTDDIETVRRRLRLGPPKGSTANKSQLAWEARMAPKLYQKDGDPSAYTADKMRIRRKLRINPQIKELILNTWWPMLVKVPLLVNNTLIEVLPPREYLFLNSLMYRALVPEASMDEAKESAREDYREDTAKLPLELARLGIPRGVFFDGLFTLVDTWTETCELGEYVHFLKVVFSRILPKLRQRKQALAVQGVPQIKAITVDLLGHLGDVDESDAGNGEEVGRNMDALLPETESMNDMGTTFSGSGLDNSKSAGISNTVWDSSFAPKNQALSFNGAGNSTAGATENLFGGSGRTAIKPWDLPSSVSKTSQAQQRSTRATEKKLMAERLLLAKDSVDGVGDPAMQNLVDVMGSIEDLQHKYDMLVEQQSYELGPELSQEEREEVARNPLPAYVTANNQYDSEQEIEKMDEVLRNARDKSAHQFLPSDDSFQHHSDIPPQRAESDKAKTEESKSPAKQTQSEDKLNKISRSEAEKMQAEEGKSQSKQTQSAEKLSKLSRSSSDLAEDLKSQTKMKHQEEKIARSHSVGCLPEPVNSVNDKSEDRDMYRPQYEKGGRSSGKFLSFVAEEAELGDNKSILQNGTGSYRLQSDSSADDSRSEQDVKEKVQRRNSKRLDFHTLCSPESNVDLNPVSVEEPVPNSFPKAKDDSDEEASFISLKDGSIDTDNSAAFLPARATTEVGVEPDSPLSKGNPQPSTQSNSRINRILSTQTRANRPSSAHSQPNPPANTQTQLNRPASAQSRLNRPLSAQSRLTYRPASAGMSEKERGQSAKSKGSKGSRGVTVRYMGDKNIPVESLEANQPIVKYIPPWKTIYFFSDDVPTEDGAFIISAQALHSNKTDFDLLIHQGSLPTPEHTTWKSEEKDGHLIIIEGCSPLLRHNQSIYIAVTNRSGMDKPIRLCLRSQEVPEELNPGFLGSPVNITQKVGSPMNPYFFMVRCVTMLNPVRQGTILNEEELSGLSCPLKGTEANITIKASLATGLKLGVFACTMHRYPAPGARHHTWKAVYDGNRTQVTKKSSQSSSSRTQPVQPEQEQTLHLSVPVPSNKEKPRVFFGVFIIRKKSINYSQNEKEAQIQIKADINQVPFLFKESRFQYVSLPRFQSFFFQIIIESMISELNCTATLDEDNATCCIPHRAHVHKEDSILPNPYPHQFLSRVCQFPFFGTSELITTLTEHSTLECVLKAGNVLFGSKLYHGTIYAGETDIAFQIGYKVKTASLFSLLSPDQRSASSRLFKDAGDKLTSLDSPMNSARSSPRINTVYYQVTKDVTQPKFNPFDRANGNESVNRALSASRRPSSGHRTKEFQIGKAEFLDQPKPLPPCWAASPRGSVDGTGILTPRHLLSVSRRLEMRDLTPDAKGTASDEERYLIYPAAEKVRPGPRPASARQERKKEKEKTRKRPESAQALREPSLRYEDLRPFEELLKENQGLGKRTPKGLNLPWSRINTDATETEIRDTDAAEHFKRELEQQRGPFNPRSRKSLPASERVYFF